MGETFDGKFVNGIGNDLNGFVNIIAIGEHGHAMIIQLFQCFQKFLGQRADAVRFTADGLNNGRTEIGFQFRQVEFHSLSCCVIAHIENEHHGDMEFRQLGGQIKTAAGNGGVQHVQNQVNSGFGQFLENDFFFRGGRGERIDAGQVDEFDLIIFQSEMTGFTFDRHAGIITHMLSCTGQCIKNAGLAAIGVTGKSNTDFILHLRFLP